MTNAIEERALELEQLYLSNFNSLLDQATDPKLLVGDIENIAKSIGSHLADYTGPIDDASFLSWTSEIIKPAAARIVRFYTLLNEHKAAINAGIRSAMPLKNFFDDSGALKEDIAQEVAVLVLNNLDDLLAPDSVPLKSKLYALARHHTLGYHTLKFRRRLAALRQHLMDGGILGRQAEVMSGTELAAQRTEETGLYHAPVDYVKEIRNLVPEDDPDDALLAETETIQAA